MKDFAKSIVCNTKVGNADLSAISKHWSKKTIDHILQNAHVFKKEVVEEAKRLKEEEKKKTGNAAADITTDGNTWFVTTSDGKKEEFPSEREAEEYVKKIKAGNKKVGNSKVGNGITKFGLGKYVIADGYKAIVLGEKEERGPNGIPFGWVTIRWVEGPWKGQSDQYYDYDLKKTGNKKVGNATIVDLMGQAKEYNTKFWEAYRKGDQKEAEKWSGYAKILKRQIAEERSDIQQRLKKLDEAEKMISFSY